MAKKSIGELHAKVTADATQFVGEFKRADNESRRSSAAINTEVDKLTKGIKKKFELADFGKDLLRGAGLFGGFSIINTGVDYFVGMMKEAEAYSKRVDDSATSIAEKFREISTMRIETSIDRLLPEAQLAARKKQLGDIENQLRGLTAAREKATAGMAFVDKGGQGLLGVSNIGTRVKRFGGEKFGGDTGMGGRDFFELMLDRADQAQAAMPALEKQADALRKQIEGLNAASVNNALTDFFGDLDASSAQLGELAKATADLGDVEDRTTRILAAQADAQARANKRFEDAAALTLAVRTPLEQYTAEIERLNAMEAEGSITTETAARALGEAAAAYSKASGEVEDYASRLADAGRQQNVVGQKATAWSSGMAAMWENVADRAGQSFADILITGENTFSSLANIVARSVIEMAARLAIINPLINGLFGLRGSAVLPAFYGVGAGKARGGGVEAGVTYRVNEQGEEFFKSNTGGTIIPAGLSAGMGEKKGGGDSYSFNYSFATGVTKAELGPLLALNQRQTLAQLADIRRRGGATARAY